MLESFELGWIDTLAWYVLYTGSAGVIQNANFCLIVVMTVAIVS